MAELKLLDVITNTRPIPIDRLTLVEPEYQHLRWLPAGQVGTIVSVHEKDSPYPQYLIEFADSQGREYAMATLSAEEILAIRFELSVTS